MISQPFSLIIPIKQSVILFFFQQSLKMCLQQFLIRLRNEPQLGKNILIIKVINSKYITCATYTNWAYLHQVYSDQMTSSNTINRLSKARDLLAQYQTQQLQSENFLQIKINLKGLKYVENPDNGEKYSLTELLKLKINDAITEKMYFPKSNEEQQLFYKFYVNRSTTMAQLYQRVRCLLKKKFGEKNFQKESLQLYCKGKLISGSENLMKINDIVKKYDTNIFTCERMETFG